MAEDKYKFYLCDRWFYLIKETDEVLKYSSTPNKPTSGITVEKSKADSSLQIFYYIKGKLYSKISVSSTLEPEIFFHYKDIIPHYTVINDEEYVNLLADIFSYIKYGNKVQEDQIYVRKKKNLHKLCYREPNFPLETTVSMNEIRATNSSIEYYLNLVSNFKLYIPNANEVEENDDKFKISSGEVKELNIPNSLYLFDREYTFVREELGKIYYFNDEDTETSLVLDYDYTYHYLESININFKENTGVKRTDCTYKAYRNECNGTTIIIGNNVKENININQQKVEDVKYRAVIKYDSAKNKISNYLEVIVNRKRKVFYSHPVFSSMFVDDEGNNYQIGNQNFARLKGMAGYSNNILNTVEKKLVKEK